MPKLHPDPLTWESHKKSWSNCQGCKLSECRKKVVLGRGQLPADIIYIGEAPGVRENDTGRPFVGPAGGYFDELIDAAVEESQYPKLKMVWTNMVACIPKYDPPKITAPRKAEIEKCSERLNEIVQLAQPLAIVMVGAKAHKYAPVMVDYDPQFSLDVKHPSAIMQEKTVRQSTSIDRIVIQLSDLFVQLHEYKQSNG